MVCLKNIGDLEYCLRKLVGCAFGHYVHVLVDVDVSQHLYEEIMVERERYAFYVKYSL
jgi:hypothetical protein